MDGEVRMDPSSISLFSSARSIPADEQTRSSVAEEDVQRPSSSQTLHGAENGTEKFSTYKRKKNLEVVKRRNLIERLDRMKENRELIFASPQLKTANNNQLSIFLRRLRKSSDIKQFLSKELMERIFVEDELEENANREEGINLTNNKGGSETTKWTKVGIDLQRLTGRGDAQQDEDNEITDEDFTDFEEDDIFGSADDNLTAECLDLLEQEMEILAADKQAKDMQNEIRRRLAIAEMALANLESEEGQFQLKEAVDTGNPEEVSMTSARCRPLLNKPRRHLVRHDFACARRDQAEFRPIISNKRCGTEEYSFADTAIHPQLSLQSSVPLDAQILKYLHVADFVPTEIEIRRFKTAQLVNSADVSNPQKSVTNPFYDLSEEFRDYPEDDKFSSAESKGIKISLALRKTLKNRRTHKNSKYETNYVAGKESETESDSNDSDYDENYSSTTSNRRPAYFKRRRMTFSSDRPGTSKLENRRTSNAVDFGSSVFNYDAQVRDIGLPLPTIQKIFTQRSVDNHRQQKVDNVEIAIPSFRKKSGLEDLDSVPSAGCLKRRVGWEEIERLHSDLELQEKNLRFRPPPLGSTSRKSTITSTNSPIMEGSNR